MVNYERAVEDEEYARNIKIGNIYYDDYIFVLSAVYASNCFELWIDNVKKDIAVFKTLLSEAEILHCQNWKDAVMEVMYISNILFFEKDKIKSNKVSREWVKIKLTPLLLKLDKIEPDNVISVLDSLDSYV